MVAAVVLPDGKRGQVPGLADSKLLTPLARERVYAQVVRRALCWTVVVIPPQEVDRRGLHVCNVIGMRRALAQITGEVGTRGSGLILDPLDLAVVAGTCNLNRALEHVSRTVRQPTLETALK